MHLHSYQTFSDSKVHKFKVLMGFGVAAFLIKFLHNHLQMNHLVEA
jgi:hypothetical protein